MARVVDLVLVNPGDRKRVYQGLGADLAAVEPPIWVGLMANHARRAGHVVEIVDANAEGLGPEETAARIEAIAPRLVAVVVYGHQPSASTQNMPAAGAVCRRLKAEMPDLPVILVGGHVAALPERTLREEAVDYTCAGEGPHTLDGLLQLPAGGDPRRVPDLCFWRDGEVVRTEGAPLLRDLDHELPGIAWDLLPMDRYRAHNWHCFGEASRQPYAALYTTLGCPFKCTFCCIQAPFKSGERRIGLAPTVNSYRRWSPARVLDELDLLVHRYGVRHVKIADELFVLHRGHVEAICDGIIERGYDLNIWAYARVDTVRDDFVEKLRRAGVRWLAFGIEAATARVRDEVQKGYAQEQIAHAIDKVRAAGIYVIGNYIFGLPEDDQQSMQATLELALDLKCEFANFYCTMAYPGSSLYTRAEREGWPLPANWAGYSQHAYDALPLPTRHLPAGEVLRFRDQAFQTYFRDPGYLGVVEQTFGSACRESIVAMASRPLERMHG